MAGFTNNMRERFLAQVFSNVDWTPRTDVDPELQARIDRLNLMTGNIPKENPLKNTAPDQVIDLSDLPPIANGETFTLPPDDED